MPDTGNRIPGRVVLCTDGKANVGLGNIEGSETKYSPYYTELAERAKTKGVSVSVVSFTGTEVTRRNIDDEKITTIP